MSDIHQSLVTIPNRFAFLERIDQFVKNKTCLSLMLVDVARFSDVSSSLGFKVGDIFGLAIPGNLSQIQLTEYYDNLIEHFKSPINYDGQMFIADFNVGAVANTAENRDTIKLLARAESAFKQAKENKYTNLQILSLSSAPHTGSSLSLNSRAG